MPARSADRERARIRRERQHGETEAQYVERVRDRLERESGLRVVIDPREHAANPFLHSCLIRGYHPHDDTMPAIRVHRASLAGAADAFIKGAWKLRAAGLMKGGAA